MNIPQKPSDVTFTDDQWKAIWATGQDMLVSAAAGSGKTKVLITRMIEKVIDEKNPIDVDELLVVTFTNAAAAEMRQRMGEALEEEMIKNPTSVHLRKQLNLLNKAQISTLHSFCQNVVRQYAYLLDIDPGFRVADSSEAALLRDDALSTILEYAYSIDQPEATYRLADSFTTDRDDQLIETLISRLYDYSRVHPRPTEWLHQVPAQYDLTAVHSVDDLSFTRPLKKSIQYSLEEAAALIKEMRRIAMMPDGPAPLIPTAEADLQWIEEALRRVKVESWEETYAFFDTLKWVRAGSIKKDSCDELLAKRAKTIRDDVKKIVTKVKEEYFVRKPEKLLEEIALMEPSLHTLVELVHAFGKEYERLKVDRGIVDFSDLEHYALKILSSEENGRLMPSEIAIHYQERFAEVLIDEYQDVNNLQETIINLVKRGEERDGNLFMVGDVKQSIYGFRLAEPNLFLKKYDRFTSDVSEAGLKIDLNANFRSRKEVLDATNFIFTQVMGTRVGGIDYDDAAALKYGAKYSEREMPTSLTVLYEETEDEKSQLEEMSGQSLKSSQAEAHYMIREIKRLMESGAEVTDAFSNERRPLEYRDIVILMRSMTWSSEIVEEFKQHGIPIYAELSKGYFEALEVMIMLNTLRVIDNPYQDIPLASVLRSPFIGLKENELAKIRLSAKNESFFEALKRFIATGGAGVEPKTQEKLQKFFMQFNEWRDLARRGSLADLIWKVYTDTYYYEMVGTMPNGKQRQANLRALHDRAKDYEKTSFRGLFRFLRFIDRMKKRGDDFGEAKALTEQEDVVRLMTIHSSKGLEFPYVFVAGMGRQFNKMDLKEAYLFDQHFGLAVKAIDPDNRITYTSLPFLAVKEKKEMEMRAEEMRVLYVAMTRAKESLTLVASVKDIEREMTKWQDAQLIGPTEMLPEYTRSRANSYMDWIGPAIARHADYEKFGLMDDGRFMTSPSHWNVNVLPFQALETVNQAAEEMKEVEDAGVGYTAADYEKIERRFEWEYPYFDATLKKSKQTVSELKRLAILEQQEEETSVMTEASGERQVYLHSRPAFMQARKLSPAEVGTAMHTMMQQIPLKMEQTTEDIEALISSLIQRELLTAEEGAAVDRLAISQFFKTDFAHRLVNAQKIFREMPFTYAYVKDGEAQILQGIADCLFQEEDGWVLLDYKTDRVEGRFQQEEIPVEMAARYRIQLNLYKTAIESILNIHIKEMVLYLFDGGIILPIQGENHS